MRLKVLNPTRVRLSDFRPNVVPSLILTESVEMRVVASEIVAQVSLRLPGMFLLIHPRQWVPVADDEMHFVYTSTFVWTKHNGVWCGIAKLTLKESENK